MSDWKDLAPDICRQRIVIEGTLHNPFKAEDMDRYCREMTRVLNMTEATAPFCNYDPDYGWCAYVHWKESGMHVYAWDDRKPCFFLLMFIPVELLIQKHQLDILGSSLVMILLK